MSHEFCIYLGIDWATEQHQACIMDSQGQVVEQRKIEHCGQAILDFMAWMEELVAGQVDRIAVAIEVPRGPWSRLSWNMGGLCSASIPNSSIAFAIGTRWLVRRTTAGTHLC